MKIEMGESLIYSWLRHKKKCQLVQMNWKASDTWEVNDVENLKALMQTAKVHYNEKFAYDIFKKSSFNQLLRQAEIDVLGVAFNGESSKIYAVDIAFHEQGVNYGNDDETAARVVKKCLRSAMCIRAFYGHDIASISFAAPKMNPQTAKKLEATVSDMESLMQSAGLNYELRIITNKDFYEEILVPVRNLAGRVADTSELFMRSLQLDALFARNDRLKAASGEKKIGRMAETALRDILSLGVVPMEEIQRLTDFEYSKRTFGINYPVLAASRNEENRSNYYKEPLNIGDESYYICMQWYENSREQVLKWCARYKSN